MPFGSIPKTYFNNHLNYKLNNCLSSEYGTWSRLKMLWELLFTMVHMQQVFGSDNYYIQDEVHEVSFVPFGQ